MTFERYALIRPAEYIILDPETCKTQDIVTVYDDWEATHSSLLLWLLIPGVRW